MASGPVAAGALEWVPARVTEAVERAAESSRKPKQG